MQSEDYVLSLLRSVDSRAFGACKGSLMPLRLAGIQHPAVMVV